MESEYSQTQPVPQETEASLSRAALEAAQPFLQSFGISSGNGEESSSSNSKQSTERSCLGHKETIFGMDFSPCGKFFATASQDSTVRIWDVEKNKLLSTLTEHSSKYECLRVAWASREWAADVLDRDQDDHIHLIATGGADGTVKVWGCSDPAKDNWTCHLTLDHFKLLGRDQAAASNVENEGDDDEAGQEQEENRPQVYVLRFIDHWKAFQKDDSGRNSFLVTSSDDFIHLWEVQSSPLEGHLQYESIKIGVLANKIRLREVMSFHFGEMDSYGYGVNVCGVTDSALDLPRPPTHNHPVSGDAADESNNEGQSQAFNFGGDRNPNNVVFVFDSTYCSANGLLGAALSDGSLRLVNGRGVCVAILNLPGCQSHLTSFAWDRTGTRLATCVATGHLIVWTLDLTYMEQGDVSATCMAIMEGGHQLGRPLYGSQYCGKNEELLVSWGVDGSLCLWDATAHGNVQSPISVLKQDTSYPIYAVEMSESSLAIGGGMDGGFLGVPAYLYSVDNKKNPLPIQEVVEEQKEDSKMEATQEPSSQVIRPVVRHAKPPLKPPSEKNA